MMDRLDAQLPLFEEGESVSVSASFGTRSTGELTHISEVLALGAQDLPF